MGKAVTSGPIRTLRACCALRVVHPFFVRASDNPVRHNSGTRCVGLKKGENLFADINILAYVIAALGVPALEKIRFVAFLEEHTHNDLASQFFIGPIEGNCSNGEPSKARSEFPVHPRAPGRFFRAKSRLSFHLCNIRRVAASCRKTLHGSFFTRRRFRSLLRQSAWHRRHCKRWAFPANYPRFLPGPSLPHERACTLVTFVPGTHHC